MANSLDPSFPEFWSRVAQTLHKPRAIYRQVANFRAESEMEAGDVFHRVKKNRGEIQDYDRYTDIDTQDITATDESLTVDKQKAFGFQVDDLDKIQSNLSLATEYAEDRVKDLTNVIDSDMLYEVVNAANFVDNEVLTGASSTGTLGGTPISLSGSNVFDTLSYVDQFLLDENVEIGNVYGAIDPSTYRTIVSQTAAKESNLGDRFTIEGYKGRVMPYAGMDLYPTNNYTRSIQLDIATQPTNGDTVTLTIGGVDCVFTFVTTIGTTAGNVLIGASADTARANLAALINAPGTTTANGVAFASTSNALKVLQTAAVASDDATANELTIYSKGRSIVGSETLTDATDGFNSAAAAKYLQFARRGSVDMVVQQAPKMEMRKEPRNFAVNILGLALYGIKTFTDGSEQMVTVKIAA